HVLRARVKAEGSRRASRTALRLADFFARHRRGWYSRGSAIRLPTSLSMDLLMNRLLSTLLGIGLLLLTGCLEDIEPDCSTDDECPAGQRCVDRGVMVCVDGSGGGSGGDGGAGGSGGSGGSGGTDGWGGS